MSAIPVEIQNDFDELWAAYPRRIGKRAALLAYARARRRGALHVAIMAGLELRARWWTAKKVEKQYIPHPATWLNQDRWEDDIDPIPGAPGPEDPSRPSFSSRMNAELDKLKDAPK